MRGLLVALVSLMATAAQAQALEFEKYEGVVFKVTRMQLIERSTTVLVEASTSWDVANGAVTYAAYAFDCTYGAYAQFHDDYAPVADWPAPIPDAGWYKAEGNWSETLGQEVCLSSGLKWLGD